MGRQGGNTSSGGLFRGVEGDAGAPGVGDEPETAGRGGQAGALGIGLGTVCAGAQRSRRFVRQTAGKKAAGMRLEAGLAIAHPLCNDNRNDNRQNQLAPVRKVRFLASALVGQFEVDGTECEHHQSEGGAGGVKTVGPVDD